MQISLIFLGILLLIPNAKAASFECSTASFQIEKVICADSLLNKADEVMSGYYSKLKRNLGSGDSNELHIEQKLWLMQREIICPGLDATCLLSAYGKRINELKAKYGHFEPLSPSEASAFQGARMVCAFPEVSIPSNLKVYGAGNYAGRPFDRQIDSSGSQSTEFDIVVNSPNQPVALILGAYDPAVWNISWTEGTRIIAVAVTGYDRQIVIGVNPDTPLLISRGMPCESSYSWGRTDWFNRLSEKLFHKSVDAISLSTNGSSVLGSPLVAGAHLVTSKAISIDDFIDKDLPLAGSAALAQALLEGSIRKSNGDERKEWRKRWTEAHPETSSQRGNFTSHPLISDSSTYVVLKPYQIPKGLTAAGMPVFYLPAGVPFPKGNVEGALLYDFGALKCHGDLCGMPCGGCRE
jgi:hypothetical protein